MITGYTGSEYKDMNNFLRNPNEVFDTPKEELKRSVAILKEELQCLPSFHTAELEPLFRATHSKVFKKCEPTIKLIQGDYLSDEAFLSTSSKSVKAFVEEFVNFLGDHKDKMIEPIVLHIDIDKDVKEAHDVAFASGKVEETEVLIEAGTTYFEYISSEMIEVNKKDYCQVKVRLVSRTALASDQTKNIWDLYSGKPMYQTEDEGLVSNVHI